MCDVPNLKDGNASRYTFLACVPALHISAFDETIKQDRFATSRPSCLLERPRSLVQRLGSSKTYEEAPECVKNVPLLEHTLRSDDDIVLEGFDNHRASDYFKPMNILVSGSRVNVKRYLSSLPRSQKPH